MVRDSAKPQCTWKTNNLFLKVVKSPTLLHLYKQVLGNRTANMINAVLGGFVFPLPYSVVEKFNAGI